MPILVALVWAGVGTLPSPGANPWLDVVFLLLAVVSLWVGLRYEVLATALTSVVVIAGWEYGQGYVNPFVVVLVAGGAASGQLLRSRASIRRQLEQRATELEQEREVFAAEAVRHERARIARELHDIVAHNVSVVVVQAAAGQRLVKADPALAAEAVEEIAAAVAEAQDEVAALVDLLSAEVRAGEEPLGEVLATLVRRASSSGLHVLLRQETALPPLSAEASAVAHRVVQEALTNALKHAPGAAITVSAGASDNGARFEVANGPAPAGSLTGIGGGHGLRGMKERALAVGGDLLAGPSPDGGWRVALTLPV